jgi:hypothetical protein
VKLRRGHYLLFDDEQIGLLMLALAAVAVTSAGATLRSAQWLRPGARTSAELASSTRAAQELTPGLRSGEELTPGLRSGEELTPTIASAEEL